MIGDELIVAQAVLGRTDRGDCEAGGDGDAGGGANWKSRDQRANVLPPGTSKPTFISMCVANTKRMCYRSPLVVTVRHCRSKGWRRCESPQVVLRKCTRSAEPNIVGRPLPWA